MKIPLITDCHFGARSNSEFFDKQFEKYYTEQFFPYVDKLKPEFIICLGDIFDNRKNINLEILSNCKRYFFDEIIKRDIELHIIVGNHDAHFKDTLKVNTPDLVLREYDNVVVIDKPQVRRFGKSNILMMPWICRDNVEESMKLLSESKAEYCFGHFEIAGFRMHKHVESHGGFEPVIFNNFKKVLSGHYHTRSTKGHITYLGISVQQSWADHDDPKGIHIFDADTGDLEFIQNPDDIFVKFEYNDETKEQPDFKNKIVRVVTTNVNDKTKFDKFIKRALETDPEDLKIIDQETILKVEEIDEEVHVEDTAAVLSSYIDSISDSLQEQTLEPTRLKQLMTSVYREASDL